MINPESQLILDVRIQDHSRAKISAIQEMTNQTKVFVAEKMVFVSKNMASKLGERLSPSKTMVAAARKMVPYCQY